MAVAKILARSAAPSKHERPHQRRPRSKPTQKMMTKRMKVIRLITWHEDFRSAKHPSFERDNKTKNKMTWNCVLSNKIKYKKMKAKITHKKTKNKTMNNTKKKKKWREKKMESLKENRMNYSIWFHSVLNFERSRFRNMFEYFKAETFFLYSLFNNYLSFFHFNSSN